MDFMPEIPKDEKGKRLDGPPTALFLVDSYESMTPDGVDVDTNPIGAAARMHSRFQKFVRSRLRKCGATWVAVNQTRMKIVAFGDPVTDGGGLALQFYADGRKSRWTQKRKGSRRTLCL
jgi:RecA/RadA recombinase